MNAARRAAVRSAALDEIAMAARLELISALPTALVTAGQTLRTVGHIWGPGRVEGTSPFGNGEDGLVSLGYLAETTAELVASGADLIVQERRYASAALIRQLVELEYLTWAFAYDRDEAVDWLRSSRQQRIARWQPRQLRERSGGVFDAADYQQHCELGGHPTPAGSRTFIASTSESFTVLDETLRFELCLHGSHIWRYTLLGGQNFGDGVVPGPTTSLLDAAIKSWVDADQLRSTVDRGDCDEEA